jgi:hypothetical protein
MSGMGKTLVFLGAFLLLMGLFISGVGKVVPFGRLPGDIYWQKGNFTFFFPLVTSILLSLLLTFLLNLWFRR